MDLVRITMDDPGFQEALYLYETAFPYEERRDMPEQRRIMAHPDYHFTLLTQDGQMMGIVLYWQTETFLFLEHLATKPTLRGKGLGSAVLALLKEKGLPIILEIEPPTDEITMRRRDFYLRNGFHMTEHHHIQAKFRHDDEDLVLKILSFPTKVDKGQYDSFHRYMLQHISVQP